MFVRVGYFSFRCAESNGDTLYGNNDLGGNPLDWHNLPIGDVQNIEAYYVGGKRVDCYLV